MRFESDQWHITMKMNHFNWIHSHKYSQLKINVYRIGNSLAMAITCYCTYIIHLPIVHIGCAWGATINCELLQLELILLLWLCSCLFAILIKCASNNPWAAQQRQGREKTAIVVLRCWARKIVISLKILWMFGFWVRARTTRHLWRCN